MSLAGWRGSFSARDYAAFKEVYNISKRCKQYDMKSCVLFAHAVAFLPLIERNFETAEKVLTHACLKGGESEGCLVLSDMIFEQGDTKNMDIIGEAAEALKTACILGNPRGCRRYGEFHKKYNRDDDTTRSRLWNTAALQLAQKELLHVQTHPEEPRIEFDDQMDSVAQRNIGEYKILTKSPDRIADAHFEIAKSIANILALTDEEEIPLVDIEELQSKELKLKGMIPKFKRDTIYRINLASNHFKDGYFLINKAYEKDGPQEMVPQWFARLCASAEDLPILRGDSIPRKALEESLQTHFSFVLNEYEAMCSSSGQQEEERGCYHLGNFWKEFYGVDRNKEYLSKSVAAFQQGCKKDQVNSCKEIGKMYAVADEADNVTEEVREYNHKRAKYFHYQACLQAPLHCLEFAEVLKAEGDLDKALQMLSHACRIGRNVEACYIMKLNALAKQ